MTPLVSHSTTFWRGMPMRDQELDAGDAGRTRAVHDQAERLAMSRPVSSSALMRPAAAMIAVPCWSSWNTGMSSSSLRRLLDDEAVRRLDVFEVDAAERGPEIAHAVDELLHIFRVDQEVHGVDVGESA